ncbi:MAG: hypothetical protein ABIT01_06565 [Thermoanaerobaculia bacterium]
MSSRFHPASLSLVCVITLGSAASCSSRTSSVRPVEVAVAPLPEWSPANLPGTNASEAHLENLHALTAGESARDVAWSADGEMLVYASRRPPYPCEQVFSISANARAAGQLAVPAEPRLLSSGRGWAGSPSAFPGDGRILFAANESARPDCEARLEEPAIVASADLYTAEANGSGLRRLTRTARLGGLASLSRSGRIVVSSFRGDSLNLATIASLTAISADDPPMSALTTAPGRDGSARFSDDGERIVYASRRRDGGTTGARHETLPGGREIRMVRPDGREDQAVTANGAMNGAPSFFPGRTDRILFSSNLADPRGRNFDLWAVSSDGTDLERITYHPAHDGSASFSPDGRRLAFTSSRRAGRPEDRDIYVADWKP